jgi:hypothetical protein
MLGFRQFANTAVALFSRAAVSSEALAEIAPTIVKRRDAWKFLYGRTFHGLSRT